MAKTKEITAINAKIKILPPPSVIANLIPATIQSSPVMIQMISTTRRYLFLIVKVDNGPYLLYFLCTEV